MKWYLLVALICIFKILSEVECLFISFKSFVFYLFLRTPCFDWLIVSLEKLTFYLSCLFWIFLPMCYLSLNFGYNFFFLPCKCFKVLKCNIPVSFMASEYTVCRMPIFLAGNPDLGFQREKSPFMLKDYFKSHGKVKMYKEFYYKMLLFWVQRRSCLSS